MAGSTARTRHEPDAPNDPSVEAAFQAAPDHMLPRSSTAICIRCPALGARTPTPRRCSVASFTGRFVDTFDGDAAVRAEPFDAIELALTALWER